MLQNASYMFFSQKKKKKKKQNKTSTKKRKEVSPGRSRTQDLRRGRATHCPLRHAIIATAVR